MKLLILISIIFALNIINLATSQHPSPCPDVFKYLPDESEPGKLSGELTLNTEFPLTGLWIRVGLDRKVDLKSQFGEVVPRDEKDFLIKNRDYNLIPGTPLKIPMILNYSPEEPIPSLVYVRLNARTICPPKDDANLPLSSCPGVFAYNKDKEEEGVWYGTLKIESEFELSGVWLRVILDEPADLLGNEFGEVVTHDNNDYLIHNRNYTVIPGRPFSIPFWVKYSPDKKVPAIKSVRLNGRTICGHIISEDNDK